MSNNTIFREDIPIHRVKCGESDFAVGNWAVKDRGLKVHSIVENPNNLYIYGFVTITVFVFDTYNEGEPLAWRRYNSEMCEITFDVSY